MVASFARSQDYTLLVWFSVNNINEPSCMFDISEETNLAELDIVFISPNYFRKIPFQLAQSFLKTVNLIILLLFF